MWSESPESSLPQPTIVPRPEHPISRKDISVEALKVLYRLHYAGYKAYLVGGSVRDLFLGKRPKDFDIATDARPGEVRKLFRNSRIIGRRFRLVQVFFRGAKIVEVSTFRRRSEFDEVSESTETPEIPETPEISEARLARYNTFGTPAEDAHRRDLTINGLFYNIADFSLVDYVGGLADLKEGIIRAIGDPAVRFTRDPVRMLRVLRHAARTGFAIDPWTFEQIQDKRELIRHCVPARIRDELLRDLKGGAARPFFRLMFESRLFYAIFSGWKKHLGPSGERRLLHFMGRLDPLMQAERQLSETQVWALFLTPYLEGLKLPEQPRELREALHREVREALAAIEFPRQRQEEVTQVMALAATLQPFLEANRPLPARLTRLAAFKDALMLHHLREEPPETLLELTAAAEPPPPPVEPEARRRRPRRRRHRGPGRSARKPQ